jgi:hypothetical protein
MFGFLKKDPLKALKKEYEKLNFDAMKAQRNGDIAGYANLSKKAEEVAKKIDEIESTNPNLK